MRDLASVMRGESADGDGSIPDVFVPTHWPANVPSASETEEIMRHLELEGDFGSISREMSASATEGERALMTAAVVPLELSLVKASLLLRWRLTAALRTAPPLGAPVDSSAFETLLGEAELVLTVLTDAGALPPEIRASIDRARSEVARDIVALSAGYQARTPPRAEDVAAPTDPARAVQRPSGARLVSIETVSRAEQRRSRILPVVFILTLLAGAGVHGYRYFTRPPPQASRTPPGFPEGTLHTRDPRTGARSYLLPATKDVSAQTLLELETEASAEGFVVRRMGSRMIAVGPASRLPPEPAHR